MTASVVQIGNSRGIRLPKNILRELNISDKVEMTVHNGSLVIKNSEKKPREGWDEAFSQMSENGEDKLLLDDAIGNDDFEWVW